MPEIRSGLAAVEAATPGIRKAYAYAPDAGPLLLPAFINVIDSGDFVTPRMMGLRETVHRIKARALVQYQSSLENAERVVEKLIYDFVNVMDKYKTLNNTTNVISADVTSYQYGSVTLPTQPNEPFIGVSFDVEVREIETPVTYGTTG